MGVKSPSGKNNTHCFIVYIRAAFKARIRHDNRVEQHFLLWFALLPLINTVSFIYYEVVMDVVYDPRG